MTPHNKCSRQKWGKMDHQKKSFLIFKLLRCGKGMPPEGQVGLKKTRSFLFLLQYWENLFLPVLLHFLKNKVRRILGW